MSVGKLVVSKKNNIHLAMLTTRLLLWIAFVNGAAPVDWSFMGFENVRRYGTAIASDQKGDHDGQHFRYSDARLVW